MTAADRVAREHELAALRGLGERARAGSGGLVLVSGEAGSGKSTLVEAFLAGVDGAQVLVGACDQLSTPRPLGPVQDLAPALGDLTRSATGEERAPHEVYAAVFAALAAQPSVLVVEDLHWADQATIDLLRFVLRRLGGTSSLVIGTLRDDEIGPSHPLRSLLGDAARSADASAVAVPALTVEQVEELIGDRPLDATWLHRLTGGNAFFVVELLDHAQGELPSSVRDVILARAADLDPGAWELLHLLACSPEALPDHLLAPLAVDVRALGAVDAAGLIRRSPRGIAFRHDLCRAAIADTIPPGVDVALHARILEVLEQATASDPAVLVHHALGARDPQRTLEHASTAAVAASRSGAHTQAAELFRIALDRGALAEPEVQAGLLERLAEECYLIDRLDQAIDASERALHLRAGTGDPIGVSQNHRFLSVYHWYSADREAAERHASDALAAVATDGAGGGTDGGIGAAIARGGALCSQAFLALHASELDAARRLAAEAARVGGVHEPTLMLRIEILVAICDVLEQEGPTRDAMLTLLEPGRVDLDEVYSTGFSNLTYLDVEQRRLTCATDLLGTSIAITVERDLPICRAWQIGSRGRLKLLEGDWDEAIDDADLVISGDSAPLARAWPHLVRGLVALRQGEDPTEDLEVAWELAQRLGEPMRVLPVAAAFAERAWLTGIDDPRIAVCRELLASGPTGGLGWTRGEAAARLRRLDPAFRVDDVAEPYALELAGRPVEAAAAWAAIGAPYEQALASIDSGDADLVRAGLDLLDHLGADTTAAWFRQDLRRRGVGSVPQRRRRSTMANAAGLTARQVDVLTLLADGLTNAELAEQLFISAKTADHHVSAILSKLGVASRRDAVRAGRELGLVG